jgi:hypothetical protein
MRFERYPSDQVDTSADIDRAIGWFDRKVEGIAAIPSEHSQADVISPMRED